MFLTILKLNIEFLISKIQHGDPSAIFEDGHHYFLNN